MLNKFIVRLCLIGALCGSLSAADELFSYGNCTSPRSDPGQCIMIKDCQYLLTMLASSRKNPEETNFLKNSQCGHDNTQTDPTKRVLVCCPDKYCKDSMRTDLTKALPGNVLPSAGECGRMLSDRIVGGNITHFSEFPWMALINYKKPDNSYNFHCGGSLINSRYVLTAGHCIKSLTMPKTWSLHSVRLGEWDTSTNNDCKVGVNGKKDCAPPHVDVLIENSIAHELYMPGSIDQFNDIGLLRLVESVVFTPYITPICLPIANEVRSSKFENTAMDVAGWGVDETESPSPIKLKIVVKTWDTEMCQNTYRSYQVQINESQLCAGGEAGIDTCRGDSGGPLMVSERVGGHDVYFIAGVVSYGPKPCGLIGWPGVYTRTGHFVDWIQNNLKA